MGVPQKAQLTRVSIWVSDPQLSDEGRLQGQITFVCEASNVPGKKFSGYYDLDRAKTVQRRRDDLRQIALAEVPTQFEGGAEPAANFLVEYFGI